MNSFFRRRLIVFAVLLAVATALFGVIRYLNLMPALLRGAPQLSETSTVDQGLQKFLESHWQKPISLQGQAPANFSALEASLRPEACGTCHKQQYADWKESLHSRAMGPGPWGQIVDMVSNSPDEAVQCMTCHAPLSEQLPVLAKVTANSDTTYEANPHLDRELQLSGITCAACHVRQHQRFGPPKADGPNAMKYPPEMTNHGGVKRTPYFERAEFCKDCHQFDPENSLLINGKPLQDTFREWQSSMWARDGVACQDCHMSNRRHLWKGIHDKEWVKGGVQFKAQLQEPKPRAGKSVSVAVEVVNSAVGHKFPTYTTPKIFVRAAVLDSRDKPLSGTRQERIIGWDARFADGEWKEFFDTRIAPGKTFADNFDWKLPPNAAKIRVWMEVHPDHFYHVHFYPAHLKRPDLSAEGRKLVERALDESGKTPYIPFEEILPLATVANPSR